jgi:hypothetical protein
VPLKQWVKQLIDGVILAEFEAPDLEFAFSVSAQPFVERMNPLSSIDFPSIIELSSTIERNRAMTLELFLPITKVDEQKRLVHGTVAEEVIDKADEIFDYASSKPFFESWSSDIAAASEGRSLGNLRAMHGQVAAGKLTRLAFDDAGRRIEAIAKVVDDGEWRKVLEGVYSGFSIGGHYARRWKDPADPARMRYTAKPVEVSLVDNPCIPTATFSVIRADGSTELRKFKAGARGAPAAATPSLRQVWLAPDGTSFEKKSDAERHMTTAAERRAPAHHSGAEAHGDYGSEAEAAYADPGYQADRKPRYPLKENGAWSEARIRAAWAYLHEAENRRPYSTEALGRIKARIIAAWKEHIDPEGFPSLDNDGAHESTEETSGKLAAGALAKADALEKIGARHSKADLGRVNAIHRLAVELGADCASAHGERGEGAKEAGEMAMAQGKDFGEGAEAHMQLAVLGRRMANLGEKLAALDALQKRLEAFEAEPAMPKGGLFVVDKSVDGVQALGGNAASQEPPTPEQAIKAALARPMRMFARFGG